MLTTIALQDSTRDRLYALKRKQRLPTMEAVILQLLDPQVLTAKQIFRKHERAIRALCKEYHVTRLVAFGSRARGDARPDSDLDLMVSLSPGASLFDVGRLLIDLRQALGMDVDLVTDGEHLGRLRDHIVRDGVVLIGNR